MLITRLLNESNFLSQNYLLSLDYTEGTHHHETAAKHQSVGLSLHLRKNSFILKIYVSKKKIYLIQGQYANQNKKLNQYATCRCNSQFIFSYTSKLN